MPTIVLTTARADTPGSDPVWPWPQNDQQRAKYLEFTSRAFQEFGGDDTWFSVGFEPNLFITEGDKTSVGEYTKTLAAVVNDKRTRGYAGKIMVPPVSTFNNNVDNTMLGINFSFEFVQQGGATFIDAHAVDPYNPSIGGERSAEREPEEDLELFQRFVTLAGSKPLIVAEWGKPTMPGNIDSVTEARQEEVVLRGSLLFLWAGADKIAIYELGDRDGQGFPIDPNAPQEMNFGVLRGDRSRKPLADVLDNVHRRWGAYRVVQGSKDINPDGNPNHFRVRLRKSGEPDIVVQWTGDDEEIGPRQNPQFPQRPVWGRLNGNTFTPLMPQP